MSIVTKERTKVNIPLLRRAVEWAEAEAAKPDGTGAWDQTLWRTERSCGTAFCIAGYICEVMGEEWENGDDVRRGRDLLFPADVANEHLGIESANGLYSPGNTIKSVRRIAEEIAGEKL